jgi:hypothetical protein
MALLVDSRNLKRIKRLHVEKTIFCGFKHISFVITNAKKTRFDIANDSRFYSGNSRIRFDKSQAWSEHGKRQ